MCHLPLYKLFHFFYHLTHAFLSIFFFFFLFIFFLVSVHSIFNQKTAMETQQQDQDLGNKNSNNSSSNYLCRQSSTRWTPTSDQIRILKELYYNNGIRSPTADQIQRIAARLRHYGKIEGKNVFYWFQNHKARERQKKRFTPPAPASPPPQHPPTSTTTVPSSSFSDHQHHNIHIQSHHLHHFYNHQQQKLYATHQIPPPEGAPQPFIPFGCSYGSLTMEKSFRECSISPGKSRSWLGVNSYSFDKIKPENETPDEDDERDGDLSADIETLPLFPIHGGSTTATSSTSGSHHDFFNMKDSGSSEHNNGGYYAGGNWFRSDGRTSLELRLNSYGYHN